MTTSPEPGAATFSLTHFRTRVRRAPFGAQIKSSKTKPRQIRPSNFAWFYLVLFVRIGTFQSVTANPNKKIFPLSHCVSDITRAFFSSAGAGERRIWNFGDWDQGSTDSVF